ncbi:PilZ domain-containing protein [Sphingomonas daechungensis]|uniref:PilZ domain-containing protein n=2 Tax=Sphingomonas daechungensis TaxID=1176646 RepID=A0ABX6SZY1_9SPHN|nr:PilZ domain-containing protein [Sphingomonas daechungensis]QNP43146.1 PilZ domain-containing protein [Sphingomonas daechungensis]
MASPRYRAQIAVRDNSQDGASMAEEHEDDPASAAKREADERRAGRSNVLLGATIEQNGARMPVRVSNLSANGALVIGDRLPVADTNVTSIATALPLKAS